MTKDKIDYKGIEKYFCSDCNRIHNRFRKNKTTKIFKEHFELRTDISTSEMFNRSFKANWKRHSNSKEYRSHLNWS